MYGFSRDKPILSDSEAEFVVSESHFRRPAEDKRLSVGEIPLRCKEQSKIPCEMFYTLLSVSELWRNPAKSLLPLGYRPSVPRIGSSLLQRLTQKRQYLQPLLDLHKWRATFKPRCPRYSRWIILDACLNPPPNARGVLLFLIVVLSIMGSHNGNTTKAQF